MKKLISAARAFPSALSLSLVVALLLLGLSSTKANAASASSNGDHFVNVRISPLGLLISYINVDVDFRLTDQWTLGPTLTYWKHNYDSTLYVSDALNVETMVIGARGTWSKNGTYQTGLYVSPMIQFVSAKATGVSKASGVTLTGTGRAPILTGLVGYQWFNGTGFMMNLGAGLAVGASSSKVEVSDGTTTSSAESTRSAGLALDGMIGYTF
ncbi:hypothetical protein BH10BDE1_BH10BDE1_35160 [soil metagenome]